MISGLKRLDPGPTGALLVAKTNYRASPGISYPFTEYRQVSRVFELINVT
jgi:hypothetical protein